MNHTLELPGLREDLARDFLATIGLLRLIDLKWKPLEPKLSWKPDGGYPHIHFKSALPTNWCQQLISCIQSLEEDPLSPLFHGEIIKADCQVFRDAVAKAVSFKNAEHPLAALPELMFAAYGGQTPDPKTGTIEPTIFSFANGQSGKSLLRDAKELIRLWQADETLAALNGTGIPISGKSFRWTPQEYRPAAHRAHDPGSKIKGDEALDYPSSNILAFFGLSCLPSISTADGCSTTAFLRDDNGWSFHWPVWSHPLSVEETIALITAPQELRFSIPDVFRFWKSRRLVAEKSVYFAPATIA